MELINLLMAFGGGVFASLIGGTGAFIFTGITALVGIGILLTTGNSLFLDTVAFGPFFGPYVAFVGAVAATAFACSKYRKHENGSRKCAIRPTKIEGQNTLMPLFITKDPSVLIVGGVFGVIGYCLNYLFSVKLNLPMDTGGLTVLTCGIATRFIFGSSGFFGKYPEGQKRYGEMTGSYILFTLIWGFFLGLLNGQVAILLDINSLGFAISAVTLIFIYFGYDFTSTHHVTMVSGIAALAFHNPYLAGVFGALAAITGEYAGRTFNTNVDTHVDREAATIAFWSLIILGFLS